MSSQLTRLQTITNAADAMGVKLTGTTRSGATYQSILEERYEWAKLKLARSYSFPELDVRDTTTADTVSGTFEYSFTTLFGADHNTKEVMAVVIEDGTSSNRLKRYLYRDFYQQYPYPEGKSQNKPTSYVRLGNALQLFPVPDDTYDIHTIRATFDSRATGDDSYSTFENKDDLLILGTQVEFYNFMQEYDDAKNVEREWKNKLKEILKYIVHPTDWDPEGRAFNSGVLSPGDFWTNPLMFNNP